MNWHRAQLKSKPESIISLQFQVLQSGHDFFDKLHKPVPDLVSYGALQLAEIPLQKPEQNRIGPAYNRERLRAGKA